MGLGKASSFCSEKAASTPKPVMATLETRDGQVTVAKTQEMTVTANAEAVESIEVTLRKLKKSLKHETDRRWHKQRFGYYEKPSILKRKAK